MNEAGDQVRLTPGLMHLQQPARIWLGGKEPERATGQRSSPERS